MFPSVIVTWMRDNAALSHHRSGYLSVSHTARLPASCFLASTSQHVKQPQSVRCGSATAKDSSLFLGTLEAQMSPDWGWVTVCRDGRIKYSVCPLDCPAGPGAAVSQVPLLTTCEPDFPHLVIMCRNCLEQENLFRAHLCPFFCLGLSHCFYSFSLSGHNLD